MFLTSDLCLCLTLSVSIRHLLAQSDIGLLNFRRFCHPKKNGVPCRLCTTTTIRVGDAGIAQGGPRYVVSRTIFGCLLARVAGGVHATVAGSPLPNRGG